MVCLLQTNYNFTHLDPHPTFFFQKNKTSQANIENWDSDYPAALLDEYFNSDLTKMMPLGLYGKNGLYVSNLLVNKHPEKDLNFWKSLLEPESLSLFSADNVYSITSSDDPRIIRRFQQPCFPYCENSKFIPPHCEMEFVKRDGAVVGVHAPTCIEILAISRSYEPGWIENLILNNHLNMTVTWMGTQAIPAALKQREDLNQSAIFFSWSSSELLCSKKYTRLIFPDVTDACLTGVSESIDSLRSCDTESRFVFN